MNDFLDARSRLAAQVIQGDDGYLFHRDHDTIEQVTGQLPLNGDDLAVWRNSIETRAAWCKAKGIAFRMMIIPEKHVAYADKMRDYAISPNRPAMQILESLDPETRALCTYPLQQLIDARSERETYLVTDTHWTFYAGFLAYKILMDDLERSLELTGRIDDHDIAYTDKKYIGDLGVRLDPEPEETMQSISHSTSQPFQRVFDNKMFSRGALSVFESTNAALPRCILFRDSFSNYIIPHLIPTFSRLVTVSSDSMHYDLVRSEKPDVVLFAIIERFLGMLDDAGKRRLPEDLTGPSITSFSGLSGEEIAAHTGRLPA